MQSRNCQVIIKEKMYCRNIPLICFNSQYFKLLILIINSVLLQSFFHIQGSTQSFPNITTAMFIKFLVSCKNLVYSLFTGNLQLCCMICYHIGQIYKSSFFCQFSQNVFLIFPPLNLILRLQMQIFSLWTIELLLTSLDINFYSWLSCRIVKPKCNISSCCIDKRS